MMSGRRMIAFNSPSEAAFRSGQLRRVEPKFLTGPLHHAHIKGLTRAAERHSRLSALSVHSHHDLPPVPPLMFAVVDTAPLLHEPFSKCSTLHYFAPALCCSRALLPRHLI